MITPDLLSKMTATLAQNKTVQVLKLTGTGMRKAEEELIQYPVMKQFIKHFLLGVSGSITLERVELDFLPWLSGCITCELT